MPKTDIELLGDIEEVKKRFILIGFKGSLADFLTELVNSKQNKLDRIVFHAEDFYNVGTPEKPILRVIQKGGQIPAEFEQRLSKVEAYIQTLDNF
jgi:hypothetical protein